MCPGVKIPCCSSKPLFTFAATVHDMQHAVAQLQIRCPAFLVAHRTMKCHYFACGRGCRVLWWVCLSVGLSLCLSVGLSVRKDISRTTCAMFTKFLCMLPMSVARSSSGMFTIGRIACRREGVFLPIENALSAGKGRWECTVWLKYAIYDCLVLRNCNIGMQRVPIKIDPLRLIMNICTVVGFWK